jgi:myo-inositol-1(or 4)-monophosphatase
MDLKRITDQVKEISIKAGNFILSEWNQLSSENIEAKGLNDFFTYVDTTSEQMLVKELKELLPEAGFIVEENTVKAQGNESYKWIVDPLDGTTNYIHRLKPFSVSIALEKDSRVILAVVNELGCNEIFYAWEGAPAFLNGSEIHVSNIPRLKDGIIGTGFPYKDFHRVDAYLDLLKYFMKNSHGIRRFGSAAVDLCYLACGRLEAFFEYGLKPWDVAAGSLILRQAGGLVSDFSGGNDYLYNQEIVAANTKVFDEFLKQTMKYLK